MSNPLMELNILVLVVRTFEELAIASFYASLANLASRSCPKLFPHYFVHSKRSSKQNCLRF